MIYILNFATMVLCIVGLVAMLWRTRRIDTIAWWALRVLLTYGLICATFMTYDAFTLGLELSMELILLRLGFVSLVLALLLVWHLLRHERHRNQRLQTDIDTLTTA